jgi:UDP-N-acetylmuramoyl-L-alanyl-D-glutamate--2,6-diaminopimelate ligase
MKRSAQIRHPFPRFVPEVRSMFLDKALERIQVTGRTGNLHVDISGVAYDSRSVRSGDLFVAIEGERNNGAHFVPKAVENGAVAIASEHPAGSGLNAACVQVPDARKFLAEISREFYQNPSEELNLVAITGTNGKTTTSYLMESICRHAGFRTCLVGTIGMKIGAQSFHSSHTTPEASDLTNFLRQAVLGGCTHGALEVSSHSLTLKRVFGMRFRVGVFMNLTRDHLDFHRDMESYFQAKQLLFTAENGNRVETAVINADDAYGSRLTTIAGCAVLRFGFNRGADIRVLDYQSQVDGTDVTLQTPAGEFRFQMQLIGRPNLYNAMAATGAALALGISPEAIRKGIEALEGVPGRVERVRAGQNFTVIVDYAHSPDALENLLRTVAQLPHAKLITVFGCGGDRDKTKRPMMGDIAVRMSDVVFATSDNPRSEDPLAILEDIEAGMRKGPASYEIVPDRRQAIKAALTLAGTGDVVVIAGKGHEDYQILGSRTIHFDDREVAREFIDELLNAKKRNGT